MTQQIKQQRANLFKSKIKKKTGSIVPTNVYLCLQLKQIYGRIWCAKKKTEILKINIENVLKVEIQN